MQICHIFSGLQLQSGSNTFFDLLSQCSNIRFKPTVWLCIDFSCSVGNPRNIKRHWLSVTVSAHSFTQVKKFLREHLPYCVLLYDCFGSSLYISTEHVSVSLYVSIFLPLSLCFIFLFFFSFLLKTELWLGHFSLILCTYPKQTLSGKPAVLLFPFFNFVCVPCVTSGFAHFHLC